MKGLTSGTRSERGDLRTSLMTDMVSKSLISGCRNAVGKITTEVDDEFR